MNNSRYTFDFEVFKNFWCVSFIDINTKDTKTFIQWKDIDDRPALFEFLSNNPFLVSFNGVSYDLPVLRFIRDYRGNTLNKDVFKLSAKLISDSSRRDEDIIALRYPRYEDYIHQDLMAMMGFIRSGVGLKQCSVNLKWPKVQDLPFRYDHLVSKNDIDIIVEYNINDALITRELYLNKVVTEARELRESLVDEFGYRILSAAKSKMANIFLEKLYEQETGIPRQTFKDLRTPRGSLFIKNLILPNIKFNSKELSSVLNDLKEICVYPEDKYKFDKSVFYKGNKYNLGVGGLHTDESPHVYKQSNTQHILTMDVASYYPALMCEYNIKPDHLNNKIITILDNVRKERVAAKKAKDKMKAESYKILLNSVFGKLGYDNYWLYDPQALIKVTINGQLFLLMLIERMEENGIRCISGNTDGIEILVSPDQESLVRDIAEKWEKETKMELEFNEYKLYAKRDVNSYVAQYVNGDIKTKGVFYYDINLEKGYSHPITARAISEYFLYRTPVQETVSKCKDIFEFCISQKMGKEFQAELHTLDGIELLQKTNRFYISNHGGALQKRKGVSRSKTGLFVGKTVRLLNDYDREVPFEDYDVNVNWYIREAQSIIDEIEPKQISMFGENIDYGTKPARLQTPKTNLTPKVKIPKEKDIREASKTRRTFNVSAKYMLVEKLDTKFAPRLEMYSLEKGTGKHILKIKKSVFEKKPVRIGDVLLLNDIRKEPKTVKGDNGFVNVEGEWVWWIYDYDIVNDFKDFRYKEHVNDN